jgi:hypothetical protein
MKNNGLLPIDTRKVRKIAVIGENAVTKMALGGVGAVMTAAVATRGRVLSRRPTRNCWHRL